MAWPVREAKTAAIPMPTRLLRTNCTELRCTIRTSEQGDGEPDADVQRERAGRGSTTNVTVKPSVGTRALDHPASTTERDREPVPDELLDRRGVDARPGGRGWWSLGAGRPELVARVEDDRLVVVPGDPAGGDERPTRLDAGDLRGGPATPG